MRADWDHLYGNGMYVEKGTFRDLPGGDLKNTGVIHFFTMDELEILFKELDSDGKPFFRNVMIEFTERSVGGVRDVIAYWMVSCTK
jgi:hypothetical protein